MWTRFYSVEGITTRCLEAGDQEAPPLVLLHGHDLIAEIWLANIDALGRNFRVFAPDMLGNGFTGPVELGDRPAVATRLAHLVKLVDRRTHRDPDERILSGFICRCHRIPWFGFEFSCRTRCLNGFVKNIAA